MRFPNLAWAIKENRFTHYRLAAALGMGETKFSRAMNGLQDFTSGERKKLSQVLGYPETWLFREVVPPKPVHKEPAADRVPAHA